ncbi:MAG: efflux RND transporter periplasmic adaptor subunit, partial [Myxococcales bacterium]|nr:efflux RND transporter periplasmic adaptor subunit [Myxococcales bacterium]
MLKRVLGFFTLVGLLGVFALTMGFLWWKSREVPETFDTVAVANRDVVLKTVATGAIVPRVEVDIKSRVSGVVSELLVEPGDTVGRGDLIARIQVIPDASSLTSAQSRVRSASIAAEDANVRRKRADQLFTSGAISVAERDAAVLDAKLAGADLANAQAALTVVREGAVRGSGNVATEVRSTVAGMVLDVPVEAGASVIESNTFNDGTTIATVADMSDMVFEGTVDESEVGRIREGMPIQLVVGAIRGKTFGGQLEYISPKGAVVDGSVQFAIRAALDPVGEGVFIRAGSSANADIVLDRRDEVLALDEGVVHYEKGGASPWVEVELGAQRFEKREVKLGLSDGIHVEVLGGVSKDDLL